MHRILRYCGSRESSLPLFPSIENVQRLPWGIFLWEFSLEMRLVRFHQLQEVMTCRWYDPRGSGKNMKTSETEKLIEGTGRINVYNI